MDAMVARAQKKAFAKPADSREKRLAADAAAVRSLVQRFPAIAAIGVQPAETDPRERPAIATDSARLKSLAERYPGFGSIGFA